MGKAEFSERRTLRIVSVVCLVGAGVLLFVALFGPLIGFGVAEQSIFYIWLGVTRSDLAAIAGVLFAFAACTGLVAVVRRWGLLLTNLSLIVGSVLISVVMLEVLMRLLGGVPVFSSRNWLAERNALLTTNAWSDHDPLLGWVPKPQMSTVLNALGYTFTTGNYGIRFNQTADRGLPANSVMAVGDSFTAGSEVSDEDSWPAQLERLSGISVINAGAGGWAADQIVLRAESLLPILAPSAVIVSFYHDDVERSRYRVYGGANKPYFTIEKGVLVHHNNPVPVYSGRVDETPRWLVLPSHSYFMQFVMDRLGWATWWQNSNVSYIKSQNDPLAVSCALLRRLRDKLVKERIEFLFVVQYAAPDVKTKPENASRIAECARGLGITTLDLWDDMIAIHKRSTTEFNRLWVSHDGQQPYGHMSAFGNSVVARRIAETLKAIRK